MTRGEDLARPPAIGGSGSSRSRSGDVGRLRVTAGARLPADAHHRQGHQPRSRLVQPGEIDPNAIVVPGLFVKRIVKVTEDLGFPRHIERNFQVKEGEL